MPYLSTSQDFLRQSSLLLEAYPHTTRITTKYSYPKPARKPKTSTTDTDTNTDTDIEPKATTTTSTTPAIQTPQPATLTLKTYNPYTGICLKYRTNKAAEVGRLIAGLGRLASGAPITDASSLISAAAAAAETPLGAPSPAAGQIHTVTSVSTGDADMLDVSVVTGSGNVSGSEAQGGGGGGGGGAKGAKKKKSGKGRR